MKPDEAPQQRPHINSAKKRDQCSLKLHLLATCLLSRVLHAVRDYRSRSLSYFRIPFMPALAPAASPRVMPTVDELPSDATILVHVVSPLERAHAEDHIYSECRLR